eukprot:15459123-Alexandrium_andersonii.AAC.1
MESEIHESHTFKSRNLGSIHPTSSRGGDSGGAQESFTHATQGAGAGGGTPLVFPHATADPPASAWSNKVSALGPAPRPRWAVG